MLRVVLGAGAGPRKQPVLPAAVVEQALLRRVTEVALVVDRMAGAIEPFDDAQLAQQRAHAARLGARQRKIVGAPRIGRDGRRPRARVTAGRILELEHDQVVDPTPGQVPGGGQTGHASPDDDHPHALARRRRRQAARIEQHMTELMAGVHDRALHRPGGARAAASRRREERTADQHFAASKSRSA